MDKAAQIKNVKFTDEQINKFFKLINDSETKRLIDSGKGSTNEISKLNGLKSFRNPEKVAAKLIDKNPNGYACFSAGYVYDDWGKETTKTDAERVESTKARIDKLLIHLKHIIDNSEFSNIEPIILNKDFQLCITYQDPYDDGNDYFGVEVYFKFCFKK